MIRENFARRLRFSLYLFSLPRNYGFQRTSDMKIANTDAVTVRLDRELKRRLAQAATKLDLSENDIVRHALRAAVNAIEANDYKIELPLEMSLARGSIESGVMPEVKYPKGKRH
jgi:predicted transcriptional regulator